VGHAENPPRKPAADDGAFAVVDIGSNSVRLVVFDALRRHPQVLFNEKVLCGLGRMVGKTGAMDSEAMDCAVAACRRFRLLADAMGVTRIEAVGTAAVREAENAPAFLQRLYTETGITARVLSGAEEAELSARGVVAGTPQADGVVGDLGGGSLELVALERGEVRERATLPLGPVRLMGAFGEDTAAMARHVKAELKAVDWLEAIPEKTFYLVGGAWRAISRVNMVQEDAPLSILHGFTLDGRRARTLAKVVARQHPESLAGIKSVPNRRVATLPAAALVLDQILHRLRPARVMTSAMGLREGLVYSHLPAPENREDPFMEAARELAAHSGRFPGHADALMAWTEPLFSEQERGGEDRRLRYAACLLTDIAWRGHPDFRAEWAVTEVVYGRFVGIDHRGRGYLGLALNQLYGAGPKTELAKLCRSLLTESEARSARLLGAALRLAQRISGGTLALLERCRLVRRDGRVELEVDSGWESLINDVVESRLKDLAKLLGETGEITFPRAAE